MHTLSSMTLILLTAGIVIGVVAIITIQKSHAEVKVSDIQRQQKMGQQNDCRNNSTCTNIGSSSFKLLNVGANDTKHIKMDRTSEQVNSVKDDLRVDTTPFLLPFP
jgi:uncharacterized protein HemX